MDNNPENIMRLMAATVANVPPAPGTRWEDRIVLGCWAVRTPAAAPSLPPSHTQRNQTNPWPHARPRQAKYFPLCATHFPSYPVTHISFSVPYARQFLSVPHVSFNMLQASLVSRAGRRFVRDARRADRRVYAWTVNDSCAMDWCLRRDGVDGVISDDPKKFLDLCDRWDPGARPERWPLKMRLNCARINLFAWLFGLLFWIRHGWVSMGDAQGIGRAGGKRQ